MQDYKGNKLYDAIIIGGGQAGLSVAYFLKKTNLKYLILDDQKSPGGSWHYTWDSLKLFSPSKYSSLSGWQMPLTKNEYPTKNEFIDYITKYESRYNFPIRRSTLVSQVTKENNYFKIATNQGIFFSRTLISATGTSKNPFVPKYPDLELFKGEQMHSTAYRNTKGLENKNILVVGGGNSGAQILAEVSKVAKTQWVTLDAPTFLPKEIDGRYLFNQANESYRNNSVKNYDQKVSLSDIIQVDSVRNGLERNVFKYHLPFRSFYKHGVIWQDGSKDFFDLVIWCTGFNSNLSHLKPLGLIDNNQIETKNTRSIKEPNLWLVGYGNWTGFASATIYGVGKTAKQTVKEIEKHINNSPHNGVPHKEPE